MTGPFKMKGYAYPGKSPTKQKSLAGDAIDEKSKRIFKASEKHSDIGDKIEFLNEDYFNDRIPKNQYDKKMKYLRAQEKQAGKYVRHLKDEK